MVTHLVAAANVDPDNLMLVGARCRDLLHLELGGDTPLRGTDDIDVGVSVASLEDYRRITQSFRHTGATAARFNVGEFVVDIMPFGAIEEPSGTVSVGSSRGSFSVEAFQSIWTVAERVPVDTVGSIRVPRASGYAVLKAHALADRSQRYEYKDADDLVAVLAWYRESSVIHDEVYGTTWGVESLERADFDLPAATAQLLGIHMLQALPAADQETLRIAWRRCPDQRLIDRYALLAPSLDARASVESLRSALESDVPRAAHTRSWPL